MRLHNPTETYVFLRDELRRQLITLKPGETISIENHQRAIFAKYVQSFNLKWLLDKEDLPAGTSLDEIEGTFAHFAKKDDMVFDPKAALDQSDAAEVAEIWKEQDTVRFVPHVSSKEYIKSVPPATDFLFIKEEDTEEGKETNPEMGRGTDDEFTNPYGQWEAGTDASEIPEEGPNYLRSDPAPEEVLTPFVANTSSVEYNNSEEEDGLPDDAPCTLSELRMSTKAQLWERCDKLGVDTSGTKNEIIGRICKYYWQVYYTNRGLESQNR